MRTIRAGGLVHVSEVLPGFWERGLAPSLTQTDFGRAMLALRSRVGWARAWRLAAWVALGESLPVRESRDYTEPESAA